MKEVKFEELVTSIGMSIENARKTIENQAVELYFQEYKKSDNQSEVYVPLNRRIDMPVSTTPGAKSKIMDIPLTALHNHNTTVLDSVDIRLKFVASERDGELYVAIKSCQEPEEIRNDYSEMSLHFKNVDVSEGMARLTDQTVKLL